MGFKVAFRDEDDGSGYFGGGYDKGEPVGKHRKAGAGAA